MLIDIHIQGLLWEGAPPERRREWLQLVREVVEQHPRDEQNPRRLTISPGASEGTLLELLTPDGMAAGRAAVPMDALAPHFREYLDICQRMEMLDEGSHSARLEALDMAKKLAHDRAAKLLLGLSAPIIPDHATARCFFTLLISLHFDTTLMVRGHRITPGYLPGR